MSHVWGVDPGVSKVAFAYTAGPLTWAETVVVPEGDPQLAPKLHLLQREIRAHVRRQAQYGLPECIWVEQPSGRHRNLRLVYAVGVIIATLFAATGSPVWEIAPAAWKVKTVGWGNATKADVADWVAARGLQVIGQDEADAACIAIAGQAKYDSREWAATVT